ncbi:hypothetical protein ABT391_12895 [Streptomyces jumonjinensis]|uniref:hypothetical protein n=2 Tax=Streptomyces jumonjinensis TaxID=1945 RepID=UPI00332DB7A6
MTNSPQPEGAAERRALPPEVPVLPKRDRVLTDHELVARQYVRWENRADTWSVTLPATVETPDGPVKVVLRPFPRDTPRGPFPRANRATLARLYMALADYRARMGAS